MTRVALRFELYRAAIELANGFEELGSAQQQRERFLPISSCARRAACRCLKSTSGCWRRSAQGYRPAPGSQLGFDRLVMLASARAISAKCCHLPRIGSEPRSAPARASYCLPREM